MQSTVQPYLTPTAILSNNIYTTPSSSIIFPPNFTPPQHVNQTEISYSLFSIGTAAYININSHLSNELNYNPLQLRTPHESPFQQLNPPFVPTPSLKIPILKSTLGLATLFHQNPTIILPTSSSKVHTNDVSTFTSDSPKEFKETSHEQFIQQQALLYLKDQILAQFHTIQHDLHAMNIYEALAPLPNCKITSTNMSPSISHSQQSKLGPQNLNTKNTQSVGKFFFHANAFKFISYFLASPSISSPTATTPSIIPSISSLSHKDQLRSPSTSTNSKKQNPKQSPTMVMPATLSLPAQPVQSQLPSTTAIFPRSRALSIFYLDYMSINDEKREGYDTLLENYQKKHDQAYNYTPFRLSQFQSDSLTNHTFGFGFGANSGDNSTNLSFTNSNNTFHNNSEHFLSLSTPLAPFLPRTKPIIHTHIAINPQCACRQVVPPKIHIHNAFSTPPSSQDCSHHPSPNQQLNSSQHICAISAVMRPDLTEIYIHLHPPPCQLNTISSSLPTIPLFACWLPTPPGAKTISLTFPHSATCDSNALSRQHTQQQQQSVHPTTKDKDSPLYQQDQLNPNHFTSQLESNASNNDHDNDSILAHVLIAGTSGLRIYSLLKLPISLSSFPSHLSWAEDRNSLHKANSQRSPFSALLTPTTYSFLQTITNNFSTSLFQFSVLPVQLGHLFQRFHFTHISFSQSINQSFQPSHSTRNLEQSTIHDSKLQYLVSGVTFDGISLTLDLTAIFKHLHYTLTTPPPPTSLVALNTAQDTPTTNLSSHITKISALSHRNLSSSPKLCSVEHLTRAYLIDLSDIILNLVDCIPIQPLGFAKAFTMKMNNDYLLYNSNFKTDPPTATSTQHSSTSINTNVNGSTSTSSLRPNDSTTFQHLTNNNNNQSQDISNTLPFADFQPPISSTSGSITTKEQSISTNYPISSQIYSFVSPCDPCDVPSSSHYHYLLISYLNGSISLHSSLNLFSIGEKRRLICKFLSIDDTALSNVLLKLSNHQLPSATLKTTREGEITPQSLSNQTSLALDRIISIFSPPPFPFVDVIQGISNIFSNTPNKLQTNTNMSCLDDLALPPSNCPFFYPALLSQSPLLFHHTLNQHLPYSPCFPFSCSFPPIITTQREELQALLPPPPSSTSYSPHKNASICSSITSQNDMYAGIDDFVNFNDNSDTINNYEGIDHFVNFLPTLPFIPNLPPTTAQSLVDYVHTLHKNDQLIHYDDLNVTITAAVKAKKQLVFNPISYIFDPSTHITPLNYNNLGIGSLSIISQGTTSLNHSNALNVTYYLVQNLLQTAPISKPTPSTSLTSLQWQPQPSKVDISWLSLSSAPSIKPPHSFFSQWIPNLSLFITITYQLCPLSSNPTQISNIDLSSQQQQRTNYSSALSLPQFLMTSSTPASASTPATSIDYFPFLTIFKSSSEFQHLQQSSTFPSSSTTQSSHLAPYQVLCSIPLVSSTNSSPQIIGLSAFLSSNNLPTHNFSPTQSTISSLVAFILFSNGNICCYRFSDLEF